MGIGPVVSEILGGVVPTPQMLLHCQKEQMLLTVKIMSGAREEGGRGKAAWLEYFLR